ncbi:MAG: DNA cytosine methyltransferase [Clostridiales Family XIII bacterium]|nr:DNA cytosine methyltransferase [Clostridiales Family XIII bacterium]
MPGGGCLTPWDVQSRRVHAEGGAWPALYGAEGGGHGYAAVDCLNPWDTQQSRVFTEDGAAPTLAGADGGGGRNPGGLVAAFLGGASAKSRSIGYSEEVSPTPESVACGFSSPRLCEPELARTLTARGDGSPNLDGGPNVVALSVHQNQAGNVSVSETAYTLATNGNATGRNAPLVAHENMAAGVTSKGDGDCFLTPECHGALSRGGGQAGQGYPAVLVAHPEVSGTLCASGAGLSRPGGMASEPDLCVAYALAGNMVGRRERNGPNGSGVSENLAFTLTATDVEAVAAALPIPIQDKAARHNGGGLTRNGDGAGNGLGVGKPGDPAPTVTAGDRHAVAAVFNRQRSDLFKEEDVACTQAARQYKDATDLVCESGVSAVDCRNHKEIGDMSGTLQAKNKPGYSLNFQNPVRAGYIVRRLTPTECERLQGFPDGWTRFGAAGEEISDTRRYQMLGNSVAIPCVAFVLGNIALQIRGDA